MKDKTKNVSMVWLIFLLIFLSWTMIFCMQGYPDNDFYNMASAGRWVVENGIMRTNPFSVEKGWPTVLQQWPYAAVLYQIYDWFGIVGMDLFVWLQGVVMAALGYLYLRVRHVSPTTALCCAPLFCLFMAGYIGCRPEMMSNSLILIELIALEKYAECRKLSWLLPIPIMFLLEANVHTTFWVFHVLFLLPYCFRFKKLKQNRSIGLAAGIGVLLCSVPLVFLNVYGARAALLLFHSAQVKKIGIAELTNMGGISFHMVVFLFGFYLFLYILRNHLLNNVTLIWYVVFGVMYLAAQRCVIQFSIVLLAMIADIAAHRRTEEDEKWAKEEARIRKKRLFYTLTMSFLIITGFVLSGCAAKIAVNAKPEDDTMTPIQATEYLLEHENPKTVKLLTVFNNGGYFTWRGFENIYMEPKTEPYLEFVNGQKDVIGEYCKLRTATDAEEIRRILDIYDFDYCIVTRFEPNLLLYMDMSDDYEEILVKKLNVGDHSTEYKLFKHVREAA